MSTKTLVVFYSVSGQTRLVAETITAMLHGDQFEIQTEQPIKSDLFSRYYGGGKAMLSKIPPKLKPASLSIADYDQILVGFPNWASHCPPAVKEFIRQNDFSGKQVYLFTTYVARGGAQCLRNTASLFPNSHVQIMDAFSLPKSKKKPVLAIHIQETLHHVNLL